MSDSYEIGFRKPPVQTRFQKGKSGNPKGRPKGSKNFKTDLIEELQERISVREGERVKKITKQRALVKTVLAKGLKGDVRAADTVMKWRMSEHKDLSADAEETLTTDERELLAVLEQRVLSQKPQTVDKGGGDEGDKNGGAT
jgi:Family of unknown function (DUF5681)